MRIALSFLLSWAFMAKSQPFTKADSLRGTLNDNRSWWNLNHYNLFVKVDIANKFISGKNTILFTVEKSASKMQIDLQPPLQIDSAIYHGKKRSWQHIENAWVIDLETATTAGAEDSIGIYYSGQPRPAKFAPWDGGFSWKVDEKKRPWVGVSCQGLGASVWWPCKDHQSDEPEKGVAISVNVPDTLVNISNGKLVSSTKENDKTITWTYRVVNPINNYDVTLNIGKYITVTDSYNGKNGKLDIEYAMLDYNAGKIETHLKKDTKDMLKAFEFWFGPYPFYEDGYRLVETSYLGMEHQSAIAYGNKFKKGYIGTDRSRKGPGLLWDFIIVHESGHEWFGNNITAKDIADMWIHEGFTTYSEVLFLEYNYNKDSANKYITGLRRNILNDKPIIGSYGVNDEGSGDMYDKAANMIHTIRQIIDNDTIFRNILLKLNKDFGKKTVTTAEVENVINVLSGKNFTPVFDQYLRNKTVPALEYKLKKGKLIYKWSDCISGFDMPVKIKLDNQPAIWIYPGTAFKELKVAKGTKELSVDANFYVFLKKIK